MRRRLPLPAFAVALLTIAATAGPGTAQPEPPPAAFDRPATGVSGTLPAGWQVVDGPVTAVSDPSATLTAASFPVTPPRRLRGCGPDEILEQMPRGGALVFVFEYVSMRARPRALARFPARPARFRLDRRTLLPYECVGRSYLLRFRDADRAFQAHVWLGRRAGRARRREVLALLEGLRLQPLPRPPDPYFGWSTLISPKYDSIRRPPGWRGLAARRLGGRPRGLFLLTSAGAARDAVPVRVRTVAPRSAVVHVVDERPGRASPRYPAIGDGWLATEEQFAPQRAAPGVVRLRAGGAVRGARFSVWAMLGEGVDGKVRDRAFLAARSLGVSWARGRR